MSVMLDAYSTWKSSVVVLSVHELITNFCNTHSTIMSELLFISSLSATIHCGMYTEVLENIYGCCTCTLDEDVEKSVKVLVKSQALVACEYLVCVQYKIPAFQM